MRTSVPGRSEASDTLRFGQNRPPLRVHGRAALLAGVCGLHLAVAAGACSGEPHDLHIVLDRLPACGYGLAPEQPFVAEVWDRDRGVRVAEASHGGIDMGEETLRVELFASSVPPARYRVRLGRCPSLVEDPLAAVRCADPEWFWQDERRLRPRGVGRPVTFRLPVMTVRCLERWTP